MQFSSANFRITIRSLFLLLLFGLGSKAEGQSQEPRGEIRVVESVRPDLNVLWHNVVQCLFEHALDRCEMVPCLGLGWDWIDDTTLEVKLRPGVRFHNGEIFDSHAVKFNFEYQRDDNLKGPTSR